MVKSEVFKPKLLRQERVKQNIQMRHLCKPRVLGPLRSIRMCEWNETVLALLASNGVVRTLKSYAHQREILDQAVNLFNCVTFLLN